MPSATLRNLGGSIAITLPKKLLTTLGLHAGSEVDVDIQEGCLVIRSKRKKYTLEEMLAGMEVGDLPSDAEWEAMPAVGKEIL